MWIKKLRFGVDKKAEKPKQVKAPIYLDGTTELIGHIIRVNKDSKGNVVSYDVNSNGVIHKFPADCVRLHEKTYYYRPEWYGECERVLKELEMQHRLMPEIALLLENGKLEREKLERLYAHLSPKVQTLIEEGLYLYESLHDRCIALEKDRAKIMQDITMLAERKLLGHVSAKEFESLTSNLRRDAQLADLNLRKCKQVVERLDRSSLVSLGRVMKRFEKEPSVITRQPPGMEPKVVPSFPQQPQVFPQTPSKPPPKKLRVLKVEKELRDTQQRFKKTEEEIKKQLFIQFSQERIREIDAELRKLEEISVNSKTDKRFEEYISKRKIELQLQKDRILLKIKETR